MNHDGKVSKADNIDQTMTAFRAALARMDANPGEAARIRNLANATDAQMAAEAEPETLRRPNILTRLAAHTVAPVASAKDRARTDAARETRMHPGARWGDAERELTVGVLKDACAEGRLTLDEYIDRIGRAYAGRTRSDLIALTADIQGKAARVEETAGRARPWWLQGFWLAFGGILVFALVGAALTAVLVSSAIGFFLAGVSLGLVIGGLLYVRYLRQEIAANVSTRLEHMKCQLETAHLGRRRPHRDPR